MTIREATADDVPDLVAMGARFRSSTGYSSILAENVAQMGATAEGLIAGADSVVWVYQDAGGVLQGMLGLVCFLHPMSGETTVGEVFWWSEYPGAGFRLLERGKLWARERGASKLQMIQPVAEARLEAVYARMGFERIEVAWQLDLEAA